MPIFSVSRAMQALQVLFSSLPLSGTLESTGIRWGIKRQYPCTVVVLYVRPGPLAPAEHEFFLCLHVYLPQRAAMSGHLLFMNSFWLAKLTQCTMKVVQS